MAGYNPGDVAISTFNIISPRAGNWNAAANFLSCSVLETIFTPGVHAEIEVFDDKDYLGNLQLAGDESVQFAFTKPNGGTASYNFHLDTIKDVGIQGSMKSKTYKLVCVSREVLSGQANYVQKAYNTHISDIVTDIFGKLNSQANITAEQTNVPRNLKIANQPLYHAIEMLRKEAVSSQYKSSNYMFWQTASGFFFKTLEAMLNEGDVKQLTQDPTVGRSIFNSIDNNIIGWKIQQNMDAMNRIKAGVLNQRVSTFNVHTNEYRKQDFNNLNGITEMGEIVMTTLDTFRNLFPNANRSLLRFIHPNQNLKINKSYMPETVPNKMVNLAQMQEQLLHMTVLGDPVLEAGKTVNCNIPQITASTQNSQLDPQASGRWLIAKLEHQIRKPGVQPRHICVLECLKGAYSGS